MAASTTRQTKRQPSRGRQLQLAAGLVGGFHSSGHVDQGKVKQPTPAAKITAHPYYKMMENPFDADSAAIPDEAGHQTVAMKFKEVLTITPNAQGDMAYVFRGILRQARAWYNIAADGTIGALNGSGGAGDAPEFLSVSTDFSAIRCSVFSVTVTYIGSTTASCGRLGLLTSSAPYLTGQTMTSLFSDCSELGPANEGAAAVVRPYARPQFLLSTDDTIPYMSSLIIVGAGLPNTPCLQVEIVRHLELIPHTISLHHASARFTACSGCVMECASNLAAARSLHVGESAKDRLIQIIKRLGPAAIRAYLTSDPMHLGRAMLGM